MNSIFQGHLCSRLTRKKFFLDQVHEQVRREYHRLVLELSDPSRSNATGGAFQQISRVEDVTW